jgi:hypothetical protein
MIPKEIIFQVGFRVAVLVMLVGAFSIGKVFAEDGGSGGHAGEGSHLSAPEGAQPPSAGNNAGAGVKLGDPASADTKNDGGKGASGEGGHDGASDSSGDAHPTIQGADGSDPIDTSISVQPRRPGNGRGKLGDVKTKTSPLFGARFHSQRYFAPGVSHRFVRNAIGARIARREGPEQNFGRRNVLSGLRGVAPGPGGHWPESRFARPTLNTSPIVKPAINNAAINGSTLKRPGVGAAKIGGANASVAGINGTTIRRKY